MSGGAPPSVFFLGLPDLKELCCVSVILKEEEEEPRSKQMKTCRELVLLFSDLLASPALDSFTEITVVMAIPFYQKGILQVFGQRRGLQLGSSQCVFPGVLQCCLSYSLITRLSPRWNKAGLYLITGRDFLTDVGRLDAVSMELNTSEGQLTISVEADAVRLPPTTLQDFNLPLLVLRKFCSDPDSILDPSSTGGTIWCHVLPSMKKGQIITISRKLPQGGPFRTYRDLKNHWNLLYGYRLPDLPEEEVVYCSVYFRLVGERLFTYPLSCIRLQPLQRCPRVDLQGALGSFLSDISSRLQSVCGFPSRLTSKACFHTVSLSTAATVQVLSGEQVNLTNSFSIRPILTQLPPPPPPPPPPQPVKPFFGSQPPAGAPPRAQGLLGNGFGSSLTQSQVCCRIEDWPSASSSSYSSSYSSYNSLNDSSGYQPPPSLTSSTSLPPFQPDSFLTSSSSSLPPFQQSSSLTPSFSSQSSSVLLPPSQTAPKVVPIFKNKCPSRLVNIALLRAKQQKEQLRGGGEERRRVSLPAFTKMTPAAAPSSSVSSLSALSLHPPPTIPRFRHGQRPQGGAAPSAQPKVKHLSSLSPGSKYKPTLLLAPKVEIRFKSCLKPSPDNRDPESYDKKEVKFQSKGKNSRSELKDVDVEKMARSNQLSKMTTATLLAWLRGRGVLFRAKPRKEELILKVMAFLAEA